MIKISFFKTIKMFTFRLFIVLILSILFFTNNVLALSAKQKQIIDSNSLYLDDECTSISSDSSSNQSDSNTANQSLRDKLAQMLMPRVDTDSDIDTVTGFKVGGIFVGRDHITELSSKIDEKQSSESPMLVSIDGEGGTVDVPIGSNPPSALEMGSMSDEEVKNIAKTFGQELHDLGVNMDLAPVADVVDDTGRGVIKTRAFGNNNDIVIAKAGAFADGLKESKVLPTFKHFPGHGHATTTPGGSTLGDSHSDADVYVKNKSQLANEDLVPFVELSQSSPSAIMVGHLIIPDVDADTPATVSKPVVTDLLRGELGYDGLVITDDMGNMAPITSRYGNFPDAVLAAIKAGNDMVLFADKNDQIGAVLDRLEQAVESGDLSEDRVDESITRINTARDFGLETDALSGCECTANGTGDFSGSNNVEIAYNFFTSKGLSPEATSGIVGNLMLESGPELDPNALNNTPVAGYPGHFGIAQWGSRQAYLEAFAQALGKPKNDFETQLKFIWHELTGESEAPQAPNAGAYRASTYDRLMAITSQGNDAVIEATDIFEANYEVSGGAAMEQRRNYALQVYQLYGGGTGTAGASNCGGTGVNGAICPDNIESLRHPTQAGYYQLPDAPNGEYTFDGGTGPEQRYGSKQLVCVVYTVALAYKDKYKESSTIDVGDLNASGHETHYKGVAVDLSADGSITAANDHNSYSTYSDEATIDLGKMFIDTGSIKNIWWCPPDAPNDDDANGASHNAIRQYAESKGTPVNIKCITNHASHFHVDIADEYIIPGSFMP